MWKIDEARYTDAFGYTYADALGSAQDVVDRFVSFYEWASSRSQSTDPPPEMAPLPYLDGQAFQYNHSGSLPGSIGPVLGNAPQVIMKTMEKASFAVTSTITQAVAAVAPTQSEAVSREEIPKAEPAEVSANTIDTSPVQPGQNSSPVAFTNMPSNATDVEPANIDDSKYFRDWYIDNVVQKYVILLIVLLSDRNTGWHFEAHSQFTTSLAHLKTMLQHILHSQQKQACTIYSHQLRNCVTIVVSKKMTIY